MEPERSITSATLTGGLAEGSSSPIPSSCTRTYALPASPAAKTDWLGSTRKLDAVSSEGGVGLEAAE